MIDAHTRLALLLGYPVEHSRSPLIHNTAFQVQGINAVYLALPVPAAALPAAVEGLRAFRVLGANVTIPHKEAVLPLLDTCTERARAVGAVNTIVCQHGDDPEAPPRLLGDNTDVAGFVAPLVDYRARIEGAAATVLGAGGAARAVTYGLLTTFRPARLTLAARRPVQADRLAADLAAVDDRGVLRVVPLAEAAGAVEASALVVNTTPVGMHPAVDATPWPAGASVAPGHLVYDLIYNPRRTRLLREAAAAGAVVIGGLPMLVEQAAAAYEQWTGRPMPVGAVRTAVQREIEHAA